MQGTYERFFSLSLDMLATAGFDGVFRDLNPSWERTLGWSVEELRSKPFLEFVHPEDRQKTIDESAKLGQPGYETIGFENRYLCKDGSYRWLAWTAAASTDEGLIYASARDITAHRTALEESRLAVREATMLKALVDATNDFVAMADPQGNSIFVNPGGLAMLGWDHFPGGQIPLYQTPAAVEQLDKEAFPVAMKEGRWQGESEMMTREGAAVPVSQVITVMRDAEGNLLGFGTIARDIRDWKRLESELRRRHAAQQEALHAMATPIIQVWDQIITLPVVGIVDSVRASDMKDALLGAIAAHGARFAIVDLTGVETVDTATADHLLRVMRSVRLLGAQGIITGIQPQVSQIMVALGVDLREVVTLRSLREGLRFCLRRMGLRIEQLPEGVPGG
jgi:rsbT co-antagonist protein RsbR